MARADVRTLLPLDVFAKIMGIHPLHFNGVFVQDLANVTTCGQPLMQYGWQSANAVSRDDIAQAIADAEDRIAQYTHFKLAPTWEIDERHEWPRGVMPIAWRGSGPWPVGIGRGPAIKTDWGHLVAGGIEGRTPLGLGTPLVYADTDSDGYFETAVTSVATTITDINEIAAYYPGEGADPAWEIRPIHVSIAGGVATLQMRREQLVNPGILEGFGGRATDGSDDTMFLTNVDVYRVFHDPQQQVQMLWEGPNQGGCGCAQSTCQTCFLSAQFGCTLVRSYRTGLITASPANWNSTTQGYEGATLSMGGAPDRVRLWYRAGYRDQTQKRPIHDMKPQWARAVAYMATALLARPLCACQNVTAQVEHWMDDLAKSESDQSTSQNYRLDTRVLANPFGTTRGALYAWRMFQRESIGEAVTL